MNHLLRKATKPFKDEAQRKQNQTKEVKTSAELSSVNEVKSMSAHRNLIWLKFCYNFVT